MSADKLIVLFAQKNAYHDLRALEFEKHIADQLESNKYKVVRTDRDFPGVHGSWSYLPLFPRLLQEKEAAWFIFCEEESRLKLKLLSPLLHRHDVEKAWFLGRALRDLVPSIIHHFAFFENPGQFLFPDSSACFALSRPLLHRLSAKINEVEKEIQFSIDPKHELAMFVKTHANTSLTDSARFCGYESRGGQHCATIAARNFPSCKIPNAPLNHETLFIAVKTCHKFHKTRVPIVKKTWARQAGGNLFYFSDHADPEVPTLDLGVPNTERGHCAKSYAILKHYLSKSSAPWLLVADDDTLISLQRLHRLLTCYNHDEAVSIGERYGYGVHTASGYDYVTGGGGVVLSRSAVKEIVSKRCTCPAPDSPDDMVLFGVCLKQLRIPIIHSSLFHQARPDEYAVGYVSNQLPISFHKHGNDPMGDFNKYLGEDHHEHEEL